MGLGGISVWQLLIILLIVGLLFGTKKLRGIGSDLGGAIKGFKSALSDGENISPTPQLNQNDFDSHLEDSYTPEGAKQQSD